MLAAQRRRKPAGTSHLSNPIRRSTTNPIRKSKFDDIHQQRKNQPTPTQYVIYALIGVAIVVSVIFFVSALTPSRSKQVAPNADANLLEALGKEAGVDVNAIISDLKSDFGISSKSSYTVSDPNKVKVTFNIYHNTNCDDSDPGQIVSVSMESAVNFVSNISTQYIHGIHPCTLCLCFRCI